MGSKRLAYSRAFLFTRFFHKWKIPFFITLFFCGTILFLRENPGAKIPEKASSGPQRDDILDSSGSAEEDLPNEVDNYDSSNEDNDSGEDPQEIPEEVQLDKKKDVKPEEKELENVFEEKVGEEETEEESEEEIVEEDPNPKPEEAKAAEQKPHEPVEPEQELDSETAVRRKAVKGAFEHAWKGYKRYAWGKDELKPVSNKDQNWLDMGLTIVDSLDTMYIMGMKDEFQECRDWIAKNLSFNKNRDVSVFETVIREVGGLLSAHALTGDKVFLDKAKELTDILLGAFNTPSGIPYTTINLVSGRTKNPSWTGGASVLSEMGTVQLEFFYLSKMTNYSIYSDKALKVIDVLGGMTQSIKGLYPVHVHPSGRFSNNVITLGALGDSFYEYLIKLYVMTGRTKYKNMYEDSAQAIIDNLIQKSSPSDLTYVAEMHNGRIVPKMDELACFTGGMFALGSKVLQKEDHMAIGEGLTKTCHQMWSRQKTGIAPEFVNFGGGDDFTPGNGGKHYLLRPETVESFFYLWRLTHNPIYRDMGWDAFQAIEKHCKTSSGYSGIRDVTNVNTGKDDLQQSFFLAETLKYLYLLFSPDDVISLDEYVFNTEAHPLPIFNK